jgi:hypothetical protein
MNKLFDPKMGYLTSTNAASQGMFVTKTEQPNKFDIL